MPTAADRAVAAWLWSERRATAAGLSAAALHGTLWLDTKLPAELNQPHRHKTNGILLHSDKLADDEVCSANGIPATTPARTAYDLGRRRGLTTAVIRLDALMQATNLKPTDVEALAERHRGARGIVQLREAIDLSDGGAESPQETRTRLILTRAGLRPKRTQIDVFDRFGEFVRRIDMGWDELDGRRRVRRRPTLDRSRDTQPRHRYAGQTRGTGMADHPRQRRYAPVPAEHYRRAYPSRAARRRGPGLAAERSLPLELKGEMSSGKERSAQRVTASRGPGCDSPGARAASGPVVRR